MSAGRLNRRVTIQRLNSATDALGQVVESWVDVATVWAGIRYLSGLAAIKADAEMSKLKAEVKIRARSDVAHGMRVVDGSTVLRVEVAPPPNGGEFIALTCEVVE
jgi:SPP1 family predicted phage head-tail adaptor